MLTRGVGAHAAMLIWAALSWPCSAEAPHRVAGVPTEEAFRRYETIENTDDRQLIFSADDRAAAFVVRRVDLDAKRTTYRLMLARRIVGAGWRTEVAAEVGTAGDAAGIEQPLWSTDGQSVAYIRREDGGRQSVERFDLATGSRITLFESTSRICRFDRNGRGLAVLVSDNPELRPAAPASGLTIDGQSLPDALRLETPGADYFCERLIIGDASSRGPRAELRSRSSAGFQRELLSVSPDGAKAVVLEPLSAIEPAWERYAHPAPEMRYPANFTTPVWRPDFRLAKFALADAKTGNITDLTGAPIGWMVWSYPPAIAGWSPDSSEVVVSNTLLPLGGAPDPANEENAWIAAVRLPERSVTKIAALPIRRRSDIDAVRWSAEKRTLTVESPGGATVYRGDRNWKSGPLVHPRAAPLRIEEGLNIPPRVVRAGSGGHKVLYDAGAVLGLNDRRSQARVFRWRDAYGRNWLGGLIVPRGSRERRPLIIQTHGFSPDKFLLQGPEGAEAPFAARRLAAAGAVVLQMEDKVELAGGPEEGRSYIAAYDAAVDKLSEAGLVNPEKVALVGWSRTSFHVKAALAFGRHRYAAAVIADGFDKGYWQWILSHNLLGAGYPDEAAQDYGGPPIGMPLLEWIKRAPGFNTDKVRTPVRIEAYGPTSLVGEWEFYALLREQGKAAELTFYPSALHAPRKAAEIEASQSGTVRWLSRWLGLSIYAGAGPIVASAAGR